MSPLPLLFLVALSNTLALALDQVVRGLGAALAAILVAGTPVVIAWLRTLKINATAREALAFVAALTAKEVAARADHVRLLKDPAHPEAGTWDPAKQGVDLMEDVVRSVSARAPAQVAVLAKGLAKGETVTDLLRTLGEAEVEALRRTPSASKLIANVSATVNTTGDGGEAVAQVREGVLSALSSPPPPPAIPPQG